MPYDSNGNASLVPSYFVQDGDDVLPVQHNPPLEDIAAMLSMALIRDGRAPLTGNLNANGNKVTNLAAPTNQNDAARLADIPENTGGSVILYDESSLTLPTSTPLTLLDIVPAGYRSIEIQGEVTNLTSGTSDTQLFFTIGDGTTWASPPSNFNVAEWDSGQNNSRPFWASIHNLDEADMSIYLAIKRASAVTVFDDSFFLRPSYTGLVGTYDARPITSIRFSLYSATAKSAAIRHLRITGHR